MPPCLPVVKMGFGPLTGTEPLNAAPPPWVVPPTGDPPAAPVPPGRRAAVHRRPHRRGHLGRVGYRRTLAGPDLLPAGHPLGVPRPGPEPRPLVPGRRRPPGRPPRRPRAAAVL